MECRTTPIVVVQHLFVIYFFLVIEKIKKTNVLLKSIIVVVLEVCKSKFYDTRCVRFDILVKLN